MVVRVVAPFTPTAQAASLAAVDRRGQVSERGVATVLPPRIRLLQRVSVQSAVNVVINRAGMGGEGRGSGGVVDLSAQVLIVLVALAYIVAVDRRLVPPPPPPPAPLRPARWGARPSRP